MGFLKDLAKAVVKGSITALICGFAKTKLDELIKYQVINNSVKMFIFFVAILIFGLSPFGVNSSLFISSVIILALLIHSAVVTIPKLIRLISTLAHYKIIPLIPMIFQGVSPSEIVAYYVFSWGPLAWSIKAKFDKVAKDWVPNADDMVGFVWAYIGKRILVFSVSLSIYLVLYNILARLLLQTYVMGIGPIKIYLVPFAMAIDCIFGTNAMLWLIN